MIGSMGGVMSGAIGEGMSDVLAVLITVTTRLANIGDSQPTALYRAMIRYPRTYKSFAGTEVHLDGEIYGEIGWRLGELFTRAV